MEYKSEYKENKAIVSYWTLSITRNISSERRASNKYKWVFWNENIDFVLILQHLFSLEYLVYWLLFQHFILFIIFIVIMRETNRDFHVASMFRMSSSSHTTRSGGQSVETVAMDDREMHCRKQLRALHVLIAIHWQSWRTCIIHIHARMQTEQLFKMLTTITNTFHGHAFVFNVNNHSTYEY